MSADEPSILLVEAVEPDRRAMAKGLIRSGFFIKTATNASEGLQYLRSQDFHGMVVNVRVSQTKDYDLISLCRKDALARYIIAVGQNETPIVGRLAMKKGADAFFRKPVDLEAVAAILKEKDFAETFLSEEESWEQVEESFSGTVQDVDILSYVQFMVLSGQDTVLEICSREGNRGLIFISQGNIRHATLGSLTGEAAFYHCLLFRGGSFKNLPWTDPQETTINKPPDFLLFEAARLRDEPETELPDPSATPLEAPQECLH